MKIAIFSTRSAMFAAMLGLSLRQAGHEVVELDSDKWQGSPVDCDLVIIRGARNPGLVEAHSHIRTFIIDSGYLNRVNDQSQAQVGYWQLSHATLNGLPDFPCPMDRFNALGLTVDRSGGNSDGYVLLLGQMPQDAALNGTDHARWLNAQARKYQSEGMEVRYRQHPRGGVDLPGYPSMDGSLIDAIAGARLVVTYNSTAGFEVLMSGVPIVCDPCAAYYEVSGDKSPPVRDRRAFLARAAYGQWRVDETPNAVEFLMNEWLPKL